MRRKKPIPRAWAVVWVPWSRQSLDHRAVFFNRVYLGTLSGDVVTGLAFQLTLLAEVVVFFGYCWGKQVVRLVRAWKIRIVNGDGELPNLQQIGLRLLIAPVSTCLSIDTLGFF